VIPPRYSTEKLEAALVKVNEAIEREVAKGHDPLVREAVELLQIIPRVGRLVAEVCEDLGDHGGV
jgi:hypothetical protein